MNQNQQNGSGHVTDTQAASGAAREKLMTGLKNAIGEAESYLGENGGGNGGENGPNAAASEARARFDDTLRTARSDLRKLEESVVARSRNAADAAQVYVNDNPWKAVGIGAAVGLLAGLLVSRR